MRRIKGQYLHLLDEDINVQDAAGTIVLVLVLVLVLLVLLLGGAGGRLGADLPAVI
jgi:hypothetical protein